MIDTSKPIVDTRTSVVDSKPPMAFTSTETDTNKIPAQPSPASTSNTVANDGGASTVSVENRDSQYGISRTVPDKFTASSYDELIPEIEKRLSEFKPLSKEALDKIRRRQKIEGIISGVSDAARAVANLMFTHQYAPNMYNSTDSMSARAKARFDKEKAERDADADKYFNYALTLGKLKDADKERGLQAWQLQQNLARQDRAYDDGRKDREDDVAFRNQDYDERMRQWQLSFDRDGEWHKEEAGRWERQFKESQRQFNVSAANDRARIALEAQRLAQSMKEGQMTFNLGSGNGNVTLSLDKLNAQTVSRIYSTLPEKVRSQVKGDPIYVPVKDENGNQQMTLDGKPQMQVVGYKPPTTEAMLIAIGANVETSPATQNAIKQVAGLTKGNKPAAY